MTIENAKLGAALAGVYEGDIAHEKVEEAKKEFEALYRDIVLAIAEAASEAQPNEFSVEDFIAASYPHENEENEGVDRKEAVRV